MDIEQEEMQFLGLFGIYKEAYKVIFRWRKIFSQITLSLILPLSFIFLAHMEISNLLYRNIIHTEIQLDETRAGTSRYNKLSQVISAERTYFWLFQAAYMTFFLILSLLSTAAVVYTIASVYTGKELSFKKVLSVVPKVWKRLMVTFICTFVAFFAYNVFAVLVVILWGVSIGDTSFGMPILWVIFILYLVGSCYLTIIWHLASVVSVLEESCGFAAMVKSQALIKGKLVVTSVIFFKLNASLYIIRRVFQHLVVHGWRVAMVNRISYGILCFLLLFKLILFWLVIQTVIYFVCKSYHHENIDKSALSNHLEVYLGEYVPLKSKDVQLEQFEERFYDIYEHDLNLFTLFNYDPTIHNVVAVNRGSYSSCSAPAGAKVFKSGKDRIKLVKGQNFILCSFSGHCQSGMKIAVNAA
ncbi:uncharacterized protein LOC123202869 [Mangifera indica]|uniref:uncharacterized protein LOC123202869 n=1 Tax=Mangifera indica TaxID=29780 RepID=UPI001CFA4882|nr:uncharacterized protein LOC123202869 [Mangifera indica]